MSDSSGKYWYLITTKPHKDAYAETQLLNQGYDVYRPQAKHLKLNRGKKIEVIGSLFPRYIFISMQEGIDDWGPIRSTLGVQGVVKFGLKPAKISSAVIDEIRSREDDLCNKAIDLDRFQSGQSVRIDKGPFSGLEAVFANYSGEQRVIILLDLLGKQTSLSLNANNISS